MKKHVLVLASAVLVVAGCSATDDANPAPSATRSTTTAAVSASPSTAPVTGDQLAYTAQAALSAARTVRFTSTAEGAGETTTSTGHGALDGTDLAIQLDADGFSIIRTADGLWRSSETGAWADALADGSAPLALLLLAPVDQANLARSLGAYDELELVGDEDVAGVSARHYRGTTDKESYVETQLPRNGVWLSGLADGEPVAVDVWVDAEDRIVRLTQSSTDATGTPFTFTTDFSEYGADVTVAPPA